MKRWFISGCVYVDKGNEKLLPIKRGYTRNGTFKLNADRKTLAVTLVAIMVVATVAPLMIGNTGGTVADDSTTVVYHSYYADENKGVNKPVLENGSYLTGYNRYNWSISDVTYNLEDGFDGDHEKTVEIDYYGTVWSTEYNPQQWNVTDDDNNQSRWFTIVKYSSGADSVYYNKWYSEIVEAGRTLVFTGWKAAIFDSGELAGVTDSTYHPGEVIPESVIDNATDKNGKVHIYATWNYLNYSDTESVHRYTMDGTTNISYMYRANGTSVTKVSIPDSTGSSMYTNFVSQFSTSGNCTFDPSIDKSKSQTFAMNGNNYSLSGDVIIQNATVTGTHTANHGDNAGGSIFANGHVLIMGLGINTGTSTSVTDYPQLFGGGNETQTMGIIEGHVPFGDESAKLSTMLIVHSGTYGNIVAGSRAGSTQYSTYVSIRGATILDTLIGACSSTGNVGESTFVYATNMNMPGDKYEENKLGSGMGNYNGISASQVNSQESTILTGGSNNGKVQKDTHVYISGTTAVWDVQGAGRRGSSSVDGTAYLDISGRSIVKHAACGSITDGLQDGSDKSCVKNTNITISGSAKVAAVFGAGYDTFYKATHASMIGENSSITVNVNGGTVGYVYGGGYRGTVGNAGSPIGSVTISITGGTILGDVFVGGRGGLDKTCHLLSGGDSWGTSDNDTTGYSLIYAKKISLNILGGTIEGNVYSGGESVPIIGSYDGISRVYQDKYLDTNGNSFDSGLGVASVITESLNVTIDNAVIKGNFFGAGKGVDTTDIDGYGRHTSAYIKTMNKDGEIVDIPWIGNGTGSGTKIIGSIAEGNYADYASVIVNGDLMIHIGKSTIGDKTEGNAYGGGALGKLTVTGKHSFTIVDSDVGGSVYGGGKGSSLNKDVASVSVGSAAIGLSSESGNKIYGSVYGGGELSSYSSVGSISITVSGYTIGNSVYGGGKGIADSDHLDWALVSADGIHLTIGNVSVTDSVYGGGAFGKVYGNTISVSIGNGASVMGSVYGGGKGDLSNIDIAKIDVSGCSVSVSIDNSAVNGSVYGGGELSQVIVNDTSVSIVGNATVGGSVFGGGQGVADNTKPDFALLKANSVTLTVTDSTIEGSTYGGGRQSRVEGNILVNLDNATVRGSVFGGGLGSTGDLSTKGSRTVRVTKSTINGSVFGSSSLGNDNTNRATDNIPQRESKIEIDNSSIGSSIYGGGFKGTLFGDTIISISDNTSVKFSVYGGADVGDVTGSSFNSVLVYGCSEITISGSGISIGRSIFGSGNSCKVDDGKSETLNTISITGLGSDNTVTMESIQSADRVDITSSKLVLTGRSDASMSQASTKYSLNHIKVLNLHDNTTLDLRASIDDLAEYGSYLDSTTLSTMENPSNAIVLNNGIIFSVVSNNVYGLVHGFTELSKNSTEIYGAYAYGSMDTDESSGFSIHENGVYTKLEPSIFTEQNCKCWFLKGTLTHDASIVASYGRTESTISSIIPVSYTSNGQGDESYIIFTGATPVILRNGSMNLVDGDYNGTEFDGSSQLVDSSMFGLMVGISKTDCTMTFGNGNGINALRSPSGDYDAFVGERKGMPIVSFTLFYNPQQIYTGYVGYVILHFIEATKANDTYVTYNEITIRLAIHTEGDTESFGTEKEYSIDVRLDQGSGSGTFSIPRSFKDYTLWFEDSTIRDGKAFNSMYIQTVSNEGNTFGWNDPMNSPILMSAIQSGSAIDSLKGSHAATLEFSFKNCESQQTTVVKLWFILRPDTVGEEIRFGLTIHITPITAYSVTFHSQEFDKPVIISVNDGKTIASTLIPSTGKYFVGWFKDEAHSVRYDFTTPVTGNLDLYADYKFTVTFVHGNGIVATYYVDADTVNGSRVFKPEDPVRNGYTFAGWMIGDKIYFTDKTYGGSYCEVIFDDTEYTAGWKGDVIKVTFDIDSEIINMGDLIELGFKDELTFNFGETYAQGHSPDSEDIISIDDNTAILKKYLEDKNSTLKFVRWEIYDSDGTSMNRYAYSDMQIQSTNSHVLKAQFSTTAILMDLNENKPDHLGDQYPDPAINAPMKSLLFGDSGKYLLKPSSGSLKGFVLKGWTYAYMDGTSGFIPNGGTAIFSLGDKTVLDADGKEVSYVEIGADSADTEYYGAYRVELKASWEQIDYSLTITPPLGEALINVLEVRDFNGNIISNYDLTKLHYGYTVKMKYDRNGAGYTFSNWEYVNCAAVVENDVITITVTGNCTVSVRQGGMYDLDVTLKIDGSTAKNYGVQIVMKNDNSTYYSLKYSDGSYINTMVPVGTYYLQISHNGKWYSVDSVSVYSSTTITVDLYSITVRTNSGFEQYVSYIPFATVGTETNISITEGYTVVEVSGIEFIDESELLFRTIDEKMVIDVELKRITFQIALRNNINGTTKIITVDYDGSYNGIEDYIESLDLSGSYNVSKKVAFYGTPAETKVEDGAVLVSKADHEIMVEFIEKEKTTYNIILKYETLTDGEYDENTITGNYYTNQEVSIDENTIKKYAKNGFEYNQEKSELNGTNDGKLTLWIVYERISKEFQIVKMYDFYLDTDKKLHENYRVDFTKITLKFEQTYTPELVDGIDIVNGTPLYEVKSQMVGWELINKLSSIVFDMTSVEFNVTYDFNGGIGNGPYPSTYVYAKGLSIDEIGTPLLEGYDFIGWMLNDTISDKYAISPGSYGNKVLDAMWTLSVVNVTVNHHTEGDVTLTADGVEIIGLYDAENGITVFSDIKRNSNIVMTFKSDTGWMVLKWFVNGVDYTVTDNSITINGIKEDADTTMILKSMGSPIQKKDYGAYTIVLLSSGGYYNTDNHYVYRLGSVADIYDVDGDFNNISFVVDKDEGNYDMLLVSDNGPLVGSITATIDCNNGLGFFKITVIFIGTTAPSGDTTTHY